MLANQLITNHYPSLHLYDKVSLALQLMDDFEVQHLTIIVDDKYIGLVSKDELLDVDENDIVESLAKNFLYKSVKGGEHFFSALRLAMINSLSLVPVVNDSSELLGSITQSALVIASAKFVGVEEPGALIVLEMDRKHFSFGEISKLVETNDAYITQFNTTHEVETGLFVVTLKINKLEVSDIIATFQRYEYSIRYFIGEEEYENELKYNYEHLMSYLKM